MKLLLVCLCLLIVAPAFAFDKYWNTSERLNRRTCPSVDCGVVGKLFFREGVSIQERRGGWVRITEYYDASCRNGHSEYVDSGDSRCTEQNGISNGQFAEWVSAKYLSKVRPGDPGKNATGIEKLVSKSDDYRVHKDSFVRATEELLRAKRCTKNDFTSMGGWVKSSTYGSRPIYFTYCGGMRNDKKVYLDASTGRIF